MSTRLFLVSALGIAASTAAFHASAVTPCERLAAATLDGAVVTAARLVPEGPAPKSPFPGSVAPMLPAHCSVQLDLKPSPDSLIKMEMWLPVAAGWNR